MVVVSSKGGYSENKKQFFLLVQAIDIIVLYPNLKSISVRNSLKTIFLNMKIYFLSWAGLTMTYKGLTRMLKCAEIWVRSSLQLDAATGILMALAYSFFQLIKNQTAVNKTSSKNKVLLERTNRKFVLKKQSFH